MTKTNEKSKANNEQSNKKNELVEVNNILTDSFGGELAPIEVQIMPEYLVLAHPQMKDTYAKIKSVYPLVEDYDIFIVGNTVWKLDNPFKFHFLEIRQFFIEQNSLGVITKAWNKFEDIPNDSLSNSIRLFETLALIYLPNGGIKLTRWSLKKARTNIIDDYVNGFKIASNDEKWGSLSDAHKQTLIIKNAKFRLVMEASVRVKTSKDNGQQYPLIQGRSLPITLDQWKMISEFVVDPKFQSYLHLQREEYNNRIEEIEEKIVT